ncbi:MAG: Uma2 family endonuclease [Archangium sp.]|nr:Uma2 family endonuclease [Archangium sp.]
MVPCRCDVERGEEEGHYEDLMAVPSHLVAEIIHGTLITMPRPRSRHARASSNLGGELYGFTTRKRGPGGSIILDEPELHLGDEVIVPDLAGWRRERMPELEDVPYFTLAPDWVCEVISPSTEVIDRADKIPIYAQHKVGHVWLIDPGIKTLEIFRLDGATYRLLTTARDVQVVRAEPFESMELDLTALWDLTNRVEVAPRRGDCPRHAAH